MFTSKILILMLCAGCSTLHSPTPTPQPAPLTVANCPKLVALADDSFAATTDKLFEVAAIYYRCRAAALVP